MTRYALVDRHGLAAIEGELKLALRDVDVDVAVDGVPAGRLAGLELNDEPAPIDSTGHLEVVGAGVGKLAVLGDDGFAGAVVAGADELAHARRTLRSPL